MAAEAIILRMGKKNIWWRGAGTVVNLSHLPRPGVLVTLAGLQSLRYPELSPILRPSAYETRFISLGTMMVEHHRPQMPTKCTSGTEIKKNGQSTVKFWREE